MWHNRKLIVPQQGDLETLQPSRHLYPTIQELVVKPSHSEML